MPITFPKVKVAVSQHEPAWLNLDEGVKKTCQLIDEAAANGAELVAFSEVWIPGFPHWLWSHSYKEYQPLIHRYMANSLRVDGPEMMTIRQACKRNKLWICLGFSERHNSSLWMATCWINTEGEVVNHRRKLKPTFLERIIWGEASGDCLNNVFDSPLGKLGSLECWEHINPLLKYNTYAQHEQIHVGSWPAMFPHSGHETASSSFDSAQAISRVYAIEGGAFFLMTSQVMTVKGASALQLPGLDKEGTPENSYMQLPGGGCSMIYGPDGVTVAGPLPASKEGFLYATLDLADIDKAKSVADPVGHYSRPDLLQLVIHPEVKNPLYGKGDVTHKPYPPFEPEKDEKKAGTVSSTSSSSYEHVSAL